MAANSSEEDVDSLSPYVGDDEMDILAADHRSTTITVVTVIFYVCVHAVCLVGNSLVLVVQCRDKRRRSITGFFLCNLAVADLAVGIFCMAQHLILVLLVEDWVFGVGPLGLILCKLYGFTRSLSYLATISILMLVAIERFLAIVHPFSSRMVLLSPTTLKWTACGAWLLSGIMSAPALLFFEVFHHEFNMTNPVTKEVEEHGQTICHRDYRPHRDIDWGAYEVVAFVLWYFIPCVVLIVLYSIIGRKLWRSSLDFKVENSSRHVRRSAQRSTSSSASMNSWSSRLSQSFLLRPLFHRRSQQSSLSSEQSDQSHIVQNRRKVIKMLVVIVVLFIVCWFPVQMRKLLTYNYWNKPFGVEDEHMLYMLRHYLVPIGDWMINLHSACNPMVYMLLSDRYRAGVKDLLCRSRKPAFQPSLHPPAMPL